MIAGTNGPETAAPLRGRLLGMCRVGRDKVDAAEIMVTLGTELAEDEKDENGPYRWPWAMPIVEAARFDPQPTTEQILGSYLSGLNWANYASDGRSSPILAFAHARFVCPEKSFQPHSTPPHP